MILQNSYFNDDNEYEEDIENAIRNFDQKKKSKEVCFQRSSIGNIGDDDFNSPLARSEYK